MFAANCFMLLVMTLAVGLIAKVMSMPRAFLIPVILTFCVVGSYSLSNRMFDVWVMLAFGLIGCGMQKAKIPLAPFVIGFVLAPVAEENLAAGLMLSGGSYWPILTRPLSLLFVTISLALLIRPIYRHWRRDRRAPQQKDCNP